MTELSDGIASRFVDDAFLSISIRNLNVKYRVYQEQMMSARQLASRGFRSRSSTLVHAVKDLSMDVRTGEAVGIIGSNGSGKSTLLRTIAGLQSKTDGMVRVRGEAHLLGVGAALKPQLSGYRNVMLGGLAMGMDRREIEERVDEVTEFSGLGDAMGRPMNTFSSGMRARLAFSIATLQVPDILLIDEALAVGDKAFKQKSLARINEIRDAAGTVLMVTHNMHEIRTTCRRVVWIEQGQIVADGDVDEVLERYEQRTP